MQRIDGATAAAALPAPAAVIGTPGYFTGGDPAVPTPPTAVTFDWLNMVQEELVAIVLAAGLGLSKSNRGQVLAAIQALIATGGVTFSSDAEAVAGTITNKAVSPHAAAALVTDRINALINGAPTALNTLEELADALGDDPNFATTVTSALGGRALASRLISSGGLLTGGGDLTADRQLMVTAATVADYIAGTSADRALTPASLAGGAGSNSYGSWTTLPGGHIMQWGHITILPTGTSSESGTITFPTPFSAGCESITGNGDDGLAYGWSALTVTFPGGPSLAGSAVKIDSANSNYKGSSARTVWWKAIGK